MNNEGQFKNIRKIIVHNGNVHYDEVIACAIASMFGANAPIVRQDSVSESDINDKSVLVLDVGGVYDPERNCYDHHQRGRDEEPECAFSLLCRGLECDEVFKEVFPWYESLKKLDSKGPFALAKEIGTDHSKIEGIMRNPLSSIVLDIFKDDLDKANQYPSVARILLVKLGRSFQHDVEAWILGKESVKVASYSGINVADFRKVNKDYKDAVSGIYLRNYSDKVQCALDYDNRGEGLSLLRVNDCPKLDFFKCKDKEYCKFAHANGFILKTLKKSDDIALAIQDALV